VLETGAAVMPFASKDGRSAMFGAEARARTLATGKAAWNGAGNLASRTVNGIGNMANRTVSGAKNGLLNAEVKLNNAMDESPVLDWLFPRGGNGPQPAFAGVPNGRTTTPMPVENTPEVARPMRMDVDGPEGGVASTSSESSEVTNVARTEKVSGNRYEGHSELTNAVTNLGDDFSHHNSSVLKNFSPTPNPSKSKQTIFSGVYDPKTNTFITKPTGNTKLSNGEIPEDLQPARGGHFVIEKKLQEINSDVDTSKTVGFTIYYREKGRLDVAFYSGSINFRNFRELRGYVPEDYQNNVLRLLEKSTGLEAKLSPRLELPD
jgi:hypothetical protein